MSKKFSQSKNGYYCIKANNKKECKQYFLQKTKPKKQALYLKDPMEQQKGREASKASSSGVHYFSTEEV